MRIMLVTGSLPSDICGVGDYTDALASALARVPGNTVAVFVGGGASSPIRNYEVLRPLANWRLGGAVRAWRAIRRWRPDVVHVQYPSQGYGAGWLTSLIATVARLTGARVLRTWHEPIARNGWKAFLLQSLSPGPAVIVRSNFERMTWRALLPLANLRSRILIQSASAIPATALSSREVGRLRTRLLSGQQRLLIFFGLLYPLKGVEDLLAVADPATDHLLVVGDDTVDPGYTAILRKLADSARWRGKVTITGHQPPAAIADTLAAADVVVLPFRGGGGLWNSSVHAAIQQGTPVVTTYFEGYAERDTELVTFVAAGDLAALQAAIDAAPAWTEQRAPRPSDWARVAAEHMDVYAQLTARRGQRAGSAE